MVLQQHYTVQLGGLTTALYSPAWWSYNSTIQSNLVLQQPYTVQLGLTTALYSPAWWSYNSTIQSSLVVLQQHNTVQLGLTTALYSPAWWSYNSTIQSSLVLQQHYTVQLGGLTTALYSPAWWSYNNTIQSSLVVLQQHYTIQLGGFTTTLFSPAWSHSAPSGSAYAGPRLTGRPGLFALGVAENVLNVLWHTPPSLHWEPDTCHWIHLPPSTPVPHRPRRSIQCRHAWKEEARSGRRFIAQSSSGLTGSRPHQSCLDWPAHGRAQELCESRGGLTTTLWFLWT